MITLIADIHQANLSASRQQLRARNLATHLSNASVADLADHVSALAAECSARGYQVAEPLGLVAARLEYYREAGR
jgi:cytochrome c553